MIYTSFSKMNENLESVAATLGFGRRRLLLNVFVPRCRSTIGEMFAYFFVNGMMTISAVSFLANTVNKPIALMINQFEAQAQMEYAAVVSLMILVVNIAVKAVFEMKKIKE
jgi:iron(III) transport system permease protein